jgi:hypothetical protein
MGEDLMKRLLILFLVLALFACATSAANAVVLIGGSTNNGNLDLTYAQEIVPGFFLPKPQIWQNVGSRTISGPYEDEMSSEPWAGPAPTPETTDGNANPPHPEGCGGPDCGVFFKPFSGNVAPNGPATGHLFQDNPATPGLLYTLTGWAGAEANFLGRAVFAVEFLDGLGGEILASGTELDITAALLVPNGEPFNYKQFTVAAIAPLGAVEVRARVSMLDAIGNPLGGGQAYVVDDFVLTAIPEPASVALGLIGILGMLGLVRRR